jgi:two-component system, NarL family, sensor kinase
VVAALSLASVALWILARSAQLPNAMRASVTLIDMLISVPVLAFPLVGALIASRRPRNPIGWILLAEGLLWAFLGMIESYGIYGLARSGSVPYPVAVYALGEWLWGFWRSYTPIYFRNETNHNRWQGPSPSSTSPQRWASSRRSRWR